MCLIEATERSFLPISSNDSHLRQADNAVTVDEADMNRKDEKEASGILDRNATAPNQEALDAPADASEEDATAQTAIEGSQADEPEEREWAPFEKEQLDAEFEDGSSIKWMANKGVYTYPKLRDNRVLRQIYPTPKNCEKVHPFC